MSSWVIVDNATGKAVFETFEKATADRVRNEHEDTHAVIPILEWLTGLNKQHNTLISSAAPGAEKNRSA